MANLTIVLDDEVEKRLRLRAAQLYGARKGALSASIQKAIEAWLGSQEAARVEKERTFQAYKDHKMILKATSLEELAEKMKKSAIDPRSVEIRSSEPIKKTVRIGMRAKPQ